MNKLVVKRSDGGVSIIIPTREATPELLERDAQMVQGYISHREVTDDKIPADRYFRNAWTDDNPTETVDINISKAKEIKINHMRVLRKPKLADLDVQFMIAIENGEDTSSIVAKKQELRDVTNLLLPDDITQLKTFLPECLK